MNWTEVFVDANNQIAPSAVISFSGDAYPQLMLLGHTMTVAGLSDSTGVGIVENTGTETGIGNATLTIGSSGNYSYSGYRRARAGHLGIAGFGRIDVDRYDPATSMVSRTMMLHKRWYWKKNFKGTMTTLSDH